MIIPLRSDETFSRRTWSGLILGLLGSAILSLANMGIQLTPTTSLLFSLAALVAITIGTVREKRFGIPQPALTKNLVQYVIGPICLLPVAWSTEPMHISWRVPSTFSLLYLVEFTHHDDLLQRRSNTCICVVLYGAAYVCVFGLVYHKRTHVGRHGDCGLRCLDGQPRSRASDLKTDNVTL